MHTSFGCPALRTSAALHCAASLLVPASLYGDCMCGPHGNVAGLQAAEVRRRPCRPISEAWLQTLAKETLDS